MLKLKLYIDGQEVELFKDENVEITSSVQNIKDVSKVFTDYSPNFTIPASPNNNQIFSHWYNVDIVGGFDARAKVDAILEVNHLPFKTGKVRLNKVNIKNGSVVSYNIQFFGLLSSLVDKFKDDYLSDLDLSDWDHEYSSGNVAAGMSTSGGFTTPDGEKVIYPLISPVKQWYYNSAADTTYTATLANIDYVAGTNQGILYSELKPAIKVLDILNTIATDYGLTFSTDFFTTGGVFDTLYLWISREKGYLNNFLKEDLIDWTSKTSGDDMLTLASDTWSGSTYYQGGSGSYSYYTYSLEITPDAGTASVEYTASIRDTLHGNNVIGQLVDVVGTQTIAGRIDSGILSAFNFANKFYISAKEAFTYTAEVTLEYHTYATAPGDVKVNESVYAAASNSIVNEISISAFIPKIKVIDFLQGIVKMYNLVIIPTTETDLYIDTLDNWYAAGSVYDITDYIINDNTPITRLPVHSSINFTYTKPKTIKMLDHFDRFDEVHGDLLYTDDDVDLDGGNLDVSLPFGQMKFERLIDTDTDAFVDIQYGLSQNEDNEPVLIDPLIFHSIFTNITATAIGLLPTSGSTSPTSIANAYMPFHGNLKTAPTYSTFWGASLNEWDGVGVVNSLYNKYWSDFITDMYDNTRRLFHFEAQLPAGILNNINLNDVLIIDQRSYVINNMNTNLTNGTVKFELLNYIGDPVTL